MLYSNFCKVCKRRKKCRTKNETLAMNILEMATAILIKFGMWSDLHGRQLHCKNGAIRRRNHGAMHSWKPHFLSYCKYTHGVHALVFLALTVQLYAHKLTMCYWSICYHVTITYFSNTTYSAVPYSPSNKHPSQDSIAYSMCGDTLSNLGPHQLCIWDMTLPPVGWSPID